MRILIAGLNYHPERISTGVYTTGLAEYLARQGHQTVVVSAHPHYPEWRVHDGWPRFGYVIQRSAENLKVVHCPLYVPRKPTFSGRILHYLSFLGTSLPVILWESIRKKPDLVIAIAPSLVSSLGPILGARLCNARLALHVQDFEVEASFSTNTLDRQSLCGRLALAFERWVLARFDMVSTISAAMMRKTVQKGVAPDRVNEFRNWADLARIRPLTEPSRFRQEFGWTDMHVILYSGNIAAKQGLEIIPEAARALSARNDIMFVICGDGSFLSSLKKLCNDLSNISFLPLQPIEDLSELLGMADVHLLPQIADVADLVLPSKLANMLASGRPVIATTPVDSDLAAELKDCGIVVPPGNSAALVDAINELVASAAMRRRMGLAARSRAVERWDAECTLGRYQEAIIQLAQPGNASAERHLGQT